MDAVWSFLWTQVHDFWYLWVLLMEVLGFISIGHALLRVRSPEGATGWIVALALMPVFAVPAYWLLGQRKYQGYVRMLQDAQNAHKDFFKKRREFLKRHRPLELDDRWKRLEVLVRSAFLRGNRVELLVDHDETYPAMLEALQGAQHSIFMEFFIIKEDEVGNKFLDVIMERARAGLRVYFLYDSIASELSAARIREMEAAGCRVRRFKCAKERHNIFRLNFRNHRKMIIIDNGRLAFTGGLNLANEYASMGPLGFWRDSFVRLSGPAAMQMLLVCIGDWLWAAGELLDLSDGATGGTQPMPFAAEDMSVMTFANGPSDQFENATMLFTALVQSAHKSVCITTPYLIPDEPLLTALKAASLAGKKVTIIIPDKPDHYLPWLAAYSYAHDLSVAGVTVRRYKKGFIHQKLVIIDDELVVVGSNNLDNRSLHLNFEISLLVADKAFAAKVQAQFDADLKDTVSSMPTKKFRRRPLFWRLAVRMCRLLSPIL